MRHPSATPTPLHALVAAISDERLVALIVALARNGASAGAAAAAGDDESDASHVAPRPTQIHKGWPLGKPRGSRASPTAAVVKAAAPAAADRKRLARLAKNAARRRALRASARAKRNGGTGKLGNGNGTNGGESHAKANADGNEGRQGQRPVPSLPRLKFMEGDGA
jgi:hypothetical protein